MLILPLILPLFSGSLSAQISAMHFSGALELGTGWGVPIDFRVDNNIFTTEDLGYRLLALPWRAGLHIQREVNDLSFAEYGMEFHRRQSTWTTSYSHSVRYTGTVSYHGLEHLALNCIDFSLKYYHFLDYLKNRSLYVFGGIAPVWVLNVPYATSMNNNDNDTPRDCFRYWNMAVNGGLALERGRSRWKLQLDLCLVSIVTSDYERDVPELDRPWGTCILPFEALVCYAYLIK